IGAESIDNETLMQLRNYALEPEVKVWGIGRFADIQTLAGSRAKIAYALGREPQMLDLSDIEVKPLIDFSISPLLAVPSAEREVSAAPQLFMFLPAELIDEPMTLPVLSAMDQLAGFRLNLIVTGKCKEQIRATRYGHLSVFSYTEMSATAFADMADIVAFFGESLPGEKMAVLALDMMRSSKVVIDGTGAAAFVARGAPALRGPQDLAALPNYLDRTVLVNRAEIGRQTGTSAWLKNHAIERLEKALGLTPPDVGTLPKRAAKTLFIPTNGNGLGHAQRCTLIAAAMENPGNGVFAAFPSCVPLVTSKGFATMPLVQRSDEHPEEYANDLLNYLRLRRSVHPGDVLVFDGGYVFDSIYRTIMEKGLTAFWIRRGLWQPGQMNPVSLDREKAFRKVIVPSEAFGELNAAPGLGPNIHHVGPIVQQHPEKSQDTAGLRDRLKSHLGVEFDELVVTMLGGGVAADRSAQLQTLCNLFERRKNCLHLIVVWPGSKVHPGVYAWQNTRAVQTKNALALCQAADLVISAAGYNSFHEVLYHAIPAIFVPQMAAYMDDQERRALAASERGLSATILASEMLLLEREVKAFLDGGKADTIRHNLQKAVLPQSGNSAAAQLIEGHDNG
ncbi:MAG: glycosyltransferase, partial [Albidovulum sp.]